MFSSVKVLIYVFDIETMHVSEGSKETKVSDMDYYQSCLAGLKAHSEDAKVFVLIHKMDLVPEANRARTFRHGSSISNIKTNVLWVEAVMVTCLLLLLLCRNF